MHRAVVADDGSSTLALCPGGGDSHALQQGLSIWPEEAGGISPSSTLCFLSTLIPGQSCSPHVEYSGLESRSGKQLTDLCLRATSFSEPVPQGEKAKPA